MAMYLLSRDKKTRRYISTAASKLKRYYHKTMHWAIAYVLRNLPSFAPSTFSGHLSALINALRRAFTAETPPTNGPRKPEAAPTGEPTCGWLY